MRIELTQSRLTAYRDNGDAKLYTERAVTHAMKQALLAIGIKAKRVRPAFRMLGLTSCPSASVLQLPRTSQYAGRSLVWHDSYAIEASYTAYNRGSVTFSREPAE